MCKRDDNISNCPLVKEIVRAKRKVALGNGFLKGRDALECIPEGLRLALGEFVRFYRQHQRRRNNVTGVTVPGWLATSVIGGGSPDSVMAPGHRRNAV
jgi:hypothetical protein